MNWILSIWDFIKSLFTRAYKKDRFAVSDLHNVLDSLVAFIDTDKNGYISYQELVKMFNDLLKNLHSTRGGKNE